MSDDMYATPPTFELRLLGGFALTADGDPVDVSPGSQRVLAFLALHDRAIARSYVSASLWPETTDLKAAANLRSALWRLHEGGSDVISGSTHLALSDEVWVDVRELSAAARHLRQRGGTPSLDLVDRCRGELLPGCWDPWLDAERERLRLERIHLCDVLAGAALDRGEPHLAAIAALSALEFDPLCESSNEMLIRAHLASGHRVDASRAFDRYAATMRREFGVEPSRSLRELASVTRLKVAGVV